MGEKKDKNYKMKNGKKLENGPVMLHRSLNVGVSTEY